MKQMKEEKFVAVIRGNDKQDATKKYEAAIAGGINVIELTFTTPDVIDVLKAAPKDKYLFGVGTTLTADQAKQAIAAGAAFIVSPVYTKEVQDVCKENNILYVPGILTINEMYNAHKDGVRTFKLFPASTQQPSFVKQLKVVDKNIDVMPSGGIDINNYKDWLKVSPFISFGSNLESNFNGSNYDSITTEIKKIMDDWKKHENK